MKRKSVDLMTYQDMVFHFHGESDRGAAVLAGSVADELLAKYLQSKMVEKADIESLFGGFGPVSTFSQRIEVGFAFGLITEATRSDLDLVRKIRNEFAHHPFDTSFAHQPITDWCGCLSTKGLFPLDGKKPDTRDDNRSRYLIAIGLAVMRMHNEMIDAEATQ